MNNLPSTHHPICSTHFESDNQKKKKKKYRYDVPSLESLATTKFCTTNPFA